MSKVLGGKEVPEIQRWQEDYQLVKCEGLFEEYLEMGNAAMVTARLSSTCRVWRWLLKQCPCSTVLQFGFITIFVAAFPLAPLFALLNNWVEIRLDAHKFVCEYQRPVAERAQNIGVWLNILEIMSHMSVTANVSRLVVTFTTNVRHLAFSALHCDGCHISPPDLCRLSWSPSRLIFYPVCSTSTNLILNLTDTSISRWRMPLSTTRPTPCAGRLS